MANTALFEQGVTDPAALAEILRGALAAQPEGGDGEILKQAAAAAALAGSIVTSTAITSEMAAAAHVPAQHTVVAEAPHHHRPHSHLLAYKVRPGDNLITIAHTHHESLKRELHDNPELAKHPNLILIGQVVRVRHESHQSVHTKKVPYEVIWGDTSIGIAAEHQEPLRQFVTDNAEKLRGNPGLIYAGEELIVREEVHAHPHHQDKQIHTFTVGITIKPGDTVSGILSRYDIEPTDENITRFARHNGIPNPNFIKPGQHFELWSKHYESKTPPHHKHMDTTAHVSASSVHAKQLVDSPKHGGQHPDHHPKQVAHLSYHGKQLKGVPVTTHDGITDKDVQKILPNAPIVRIHRYLPLFLAALKRDHIDTPQMVAYGFATIKAENSTLAPISERDSGAQYEFRADLGNTELGDGEKYKGEGTSQLTGKENYEEEQAKLEAHGFHVNIVAHPEQVRDPAIDAQVLADFLASRHWHIGQKLAAHDLAGARAIYNGGYNGLDTFEAGMHAAEKVVPMNSKGPVALEIPDQAKANEQNNLFTSIEPQPNLAENLASWMETQYNNWPAGLTDEGNTNSYIKRYTYGGLGFSYCSTTVATGLGASGMDAFKTSYIVNLNGTSYDTAGVKFMWNLLSDPADHAFQTYTHDQMQVQNLTYQRGDLIFFNWDGGTVDNLETDPFPNHIGVVVGVDNSNNPIVISANYHDRISKDTFTNPNQIVGIARPQAPAAATPTSENTSSSATPESTSDNNQVAGTPQSTAPGASNAVSPAPSPSNGTEQSGTSNDSPDAQTTSPTQPVPVASNPSAADSQ